MWYVKKKLSQYVRFFGIGTNTLIVLRKIIGPAPKLKED
jgi:hypothetical protein